MRINKSTFTASPFQRHTLAPVPRGLRWVLTRALEKPSPDALASLLLNVMEGGAKGRQAGDLIARYVAGGVLLLARGSGPEGIEDAFSEGMIAATRAVESFDPNKGASFHTHAMWQAKGAISTMRRRERANKRLATASMDDAVFRGDEDTLHLHDTLEDVNAINAEDALLKSATKLEVRRILKNTFRSINRSEVRKTMHLLYVKGVSIEIAAKRRGVQIDAIRKAQHAGLNRVRAYLGLPEVERAKYAKRGRPSKS